MKKVILTLVLGIAATASATTWLDVACRKYKEGAPEWNQCVVKALQDQAAGVTHYYTGGSPVNPQMPPSTVTAQQMSAQTTGDARCANSTAGNYWMEVTQNSGYCTSPPAQTSASAQTSNWLDAACPNKELEEAWRQCVMAAVSAKAEARENMSNEQVAQQKLLQQQAEYQRQFQQQVELTRRQMVLNALHAAYASGARTRISEQSD